MGIQCSRDLSRYHFLCVETTCLGYLRYQEYWRKPLSGVLLLYMEMYDPIRELFNHYDSDYTEDAMQPR
jgi:hypothetical protein